MAQRARGGPVVQSLEALCEPVGQWGIHDQDDHAPVALGRVCDLEVVDVDVEIGGEGGDRSDLPLAVEHRDPDLEQFGRRRCTRGKAHPRRPCGLEAVEQPIPIGLRDLSPHLPQRPDQVVEGLGDGCPVLGTDVGPDPRLSCRYPGHVPEAARRESQDRRVLLGPPCGEPDQRRSGQVRDVGDERHEGIVTVRREGHNLGAE
jgi:hypothetical protein